MRRVDGLRVVLDEALVHNQYLAGIQQQGVKHVRIHWLWQQ